MKRNRKDTFVWEPVLLTQDTPRSPAERTGRSTFLSAASVLMVLLILGVFPLLLLRNGVDWLDWFTQYSYSGFTETKRDTMWFVSALCTCLAVPVLIAGFREIRWSSASRILGLLLFLWMGVTAVHGSFARQQNRLGELVVQVGAGRFEGMTTQIAYGALLLAFSLRKPSLKSTVLFGAVSMLAFASVTLLQYMGQNPLGLYPRGRSIYTNYEFQSLTGNIDMGAGFLTLISALLLGYFVTEGKAFGALALVPGLLGVLLILMTGVQAGYIAIYGGGMLLLVVMMRYPACRSRGFVLLGLLAAALTLRQVIGLPWVDGLEAPWYCEQRPDAILPKLTGTEAIIFPWNLSWKKLLPLACSALCFGLAAITRKHPGLAFRRWIPWTLLALGLSAYVLAIYLVDIPWTAGSPWELHEILNGRPQDIFGSERWGVWTHTLHIVKDNLLFGTGPDTFMYAMDQHLLAEGARLQQHFDAPHNMFLAVLVQNGVPGLLLYLGTILTALIAGSRDRKAWPLIAAIICYLAQGIFSFSIVIVTPMFWAVLGMLIACGCKRQPGRKPQPA